MSRVVVVFGATGQQGGGVARTLLADKTFLVRAVTRDKSSQNALALAELGAELVQADLHDEASLRRALAGSFGVFAVTDYW
ncbi:hypothetical protein WJX73_008809 [Symbiochloris irregularis]|uniref:NmrA-like domain-containing protein n=1 Tax=Symbiochloris irregularis TaxID=706552 RepID=A0AAW1PCC1_9CHLO